MVHISTLLRHYKRKDIQEEIIENAKDREVAVKYGEKGFGKRPDVLKYPNDVLEFAKQGATSFHCSEELWSNPLSLDPMLKRSELNELRIGWDLVLDIDCPYWEFAKITAYLMIKALRDHGVKSISCKFSGNKGFHIGVPFESFKAKNVNELFPEAARSIASYLLDFMSEKYINVKGNEVITFDNRMKYNLQDLKKITGKDFKGLTKLVCSRCHNEIKEVKDKKDDFICPKCERVEASASEEYKICPKCKIIMKKISSKSKLCDCGSNEFNYRFNPLSIVDVDTILISPRHLFRMPYSLHEKSGLASLPINPDKVLEFEKEHAKLPIKVSEFRFLDMSNVEAGEAKQLLAKALEFARKEEESKVDFKKEFEIPEDAVPSKFFPPCITKTLNGLKDGKKRALFILVNFLSCTGYGYEQIEKIVKEWNDKNNEKLRENYIVGHLRYHKQRKKNILPPNCQNGMYYKDIGICHPDNLCSKIKNPVNYSLRKTRFKQ